MPAQRILGRCYLPGPSTFGWSPPGDSSAVLRLKSACNEDPKDMFSPLNLECAMDWEKAHPMFGPIYMNAYRCPYFNSSQRVQSTIFPEGGSEVGQGCATGMEQSCQPVEAQPPPQAAAAKHTRASIENPPPRLVIHNNSVMAVTSDAVDNVAITYTAPKPELASVGVVPGTPLINGRWIAPGVFEGTAVVFAPWCGRVFPYPVKGAQDDAGALVLEGAAPLITQWCGIAGYAFNANSHLVFWPYQQQDARRWHASSTF